MWKRIDQTINAALIIIFLFFAGGAVADVEDDQLDELIALNYAISLLSYDINAIHSVMWSTYYGVSNIEGDLWGILYALSEGGPLYDTIYGIYGETIMINSNLSEIVTNMSNIITNMHYQHTNLIWCLDEDFEDLAEAISNAFETIVADFVGNANPTDVPWPSPPWDLSDISTHVVAIRDYASNINDNVSGIVAIAGDMHSEMYGDGIGVQLKSIAPGLLSAGNYVPVIGGTNVFRVAVTNFDDTDFDDPNFASNGITDEINFSGWGEEYSGEHAGFSVGTNDFQIDTDSINNDLIDDVKNLVTVSLPKGLVLDFSGFGTTRTRDSTPVDQLFNGENFVFDFSGTVVEDVAEWMRNMLTVCTIIFTVFAIVKMPAGGGVE